MTHLDLIVMYDKGGFIDRIMKEAKIGLGTMKEKCFLYVNDLVLYRESEGILSDGWMFLSIQKKVSIVMMFGGGRKDHCMKTRDGK